MAYGSNNPAGDAYETSETLDRPRFRWTGAEPLGGFLGAWRRRMEIFNHFDDIPDELANSVEPRAGYDPHLRAREFWLDLGTHRTRGDAWDFAEQLIAVRN